ncbi:hypothetical protein BCD67_03990 [Oscillatoriales cyanobacterium USR001]|nr:hypothetical protein BCD67_03990 [Oscillatoriales cyanobacterium USR001]
MQIKTSKSGIRMVLAALSAVGAVCFLPQPSWAQNSGATNSAAPLQDLQTQDNTDPFTGRGGMGVFDLIHRSQLGLGRDINEFTLEQHQNLTDAAAQFRAKQRQLIEQQAKQKEEAIAAPTEGIAPDGVAPLPQ